MEHVSRIEVDVAVIGAGPAGIAAAMRAAERGRRVIMLDENPNLGGQVWRHRAGMLADNTGQRWVERLARSGASRWQGAVVVDARKAGDGFELVVESSSPAAVLRASRVIIATGARERFLPFPGWTLPGVMGIGAAQAMLKGGASFAGERVAMAGSGPLLFPVAASLVSHGATLAFLAEQADGKEVRRFAANLWKSPRLLLQAAKYRRAFAGTPYRCGWWVTKAFGSDRIEAVAMTNGHKTRTIECSLLCTGFGLVPNVELARLLGCELDGSAVRVDEAQLTSVPGVYCAGEPTGIGGVDLAIAEGEIAGHSAAGNTRQARRGRGRVLRLRAYAARMDATFRLREELRHLATPDTIICRCEDVRMGDIDPQWGARKAKLYTRAGMGPCQGRVCGSALEFVHGWTADRTRLPTEPALVSTLIAAGAPAAPTHEHGAR